MHDKHSYVASPKKKEQQKEDPSLPLSTMASSSAEKQEIGGCSGYYQSNKTEVRTTRGQVKRQRIEVSSGYDGSNMTRVRTVGAQLKRQRIGGRSGYHGGTKTHVDARRAQPERALRNDDEGPEHKDMLSMLPDDILVSIVEKLDKRQAVAVCSLSRRWIHIPRMRPVVILDACDFMPVFAGYRLCTSSCTLSQWRKLCLLDMQPGMTAFVHAIYHLLNSRISNHKIKTLRLVFPLVSEQSTRKIALFLKNAARHNKFDGLEASIKWPRCPRRADASSIKLRTLVRQFSNALGSLTKLTLGGIEIGDHDLNDLLKLSPHLEALYINRCMSLGNMHDVLEVDAPHSKLKDVVVEKCVGLQRIKFLHVPQLERVVCDVIVELSCHSTRRIKHVHIMFHANRCSDFQCRIGEIMADPSRVEELSLGFRFGKVWIVPELLSTPLSKLRSLFLYDIPVKHDLLWIAFLLQAAPFLEALHFNVNVEHHFHEMLPAITLRWNGLSEFRHHHHLKEIEMFGFRGQNSYMCFLRLVMERAVALEAVTLHGNHMLEPHGIKDYCKLFTREVNNDRGQWWVCEADQKDSLLEQLKEGIFSTARVVID